MIKRRHPHFFANEKRALSPFCYCVNLTPLLVLIVTAGVLMFPKSYSAGQMPAQNPVADGPTRAYPRLGDPGAVPWSQRQTDGNAIGFVVSNFGFFGNNLVTRAPSMEYPLGSEIEHLVGAGLWVAGVNADGDTVVSTGYTSVYWGVGVGSEFTPRTEIRERSTLEESPAFSEKAISEQDFIAEYTDYPRSETNRSTLDVRVRQESYLWSYGFAEAFVLVRLAVINEGNGALKDIYLGIFAELASGWKGAYEVWRPPSSAWFMNKALEYFEHARMCAEHHYNYQNGDAPSWGAFALLGAYGPGVGHIDDLTVSFNWWDWYWQRDNILEDMDRHKIMASGEIDPTAEITPRADDPLELVSAGPFDHVAPGDSIVLVCAFLGGMDRQSLIENAWWAQKAFDQGYVLPSEPSLSRPNPNPAIRKTNVGFFLAEPAHVRITIYDVRGRLVDVLVDEQMGSGSHTVEWRGRGRESRDLSSGVYFCHMSAEDHTSTAKIVILK
jgi:hypothetical protein